MPVSAVSLGTSGSVPALSLGTSCFAFGAAGAGFTGVDGFLALGLGLVGALGAGVAEPTAFLGAAGLLLLLLVLWAFLGAALLREGGVGAMGWEF